MQGQTSGCLSRFIFLVVLGIFGLLLWLNARPAPDVIAIVPTQAATTESSASFSTLLAPGFGLNATPLPTIVIGTEQYSPPTLALPTIVTGTPIAADQVAANVVPTFTPFGVGVTPTLPPSTPTLASTDLPVTIAVVTRPPDEWNPPALEPPYSRDPYGYDHYWFARPIDADATNYGIFYYPYGSDGPEEQNPYRIHHGIDMPNPVGETVRAAGTGTVIWASDGLTVNDGVFQNSYSYGNVVVIQHDFSYRGQQLYTLYAHLSQVLVQNGDYVQTGEAIGLVGQSGRVSGPHVHFEVRMGQNTYGSTYNPVLWMASYVGTGVIAGRVADFNGNWLADKEVTLRSLANGLTAAVTTTYIFQNTVDDVNSDPSWNENFAIGDVPVGRYEVIVTIDGVRVSRIVQVQEGMTIFVDLHPEEPATPQPVTPEVPTLTPSA
jgi:murein DD-endopeptidase MepM/ murein hydrolase activator NlpD